MRLSPAVFVLLALAQVKSYPTGYVGETVHGATGSVGIGAPKETTSTSHHGSQYAQHGTPSSHGASSAQQGAFALGSSSPTAGAEQAVDKAGVVINGVLKKATGLVDTGAHIGTGIVNAKVGVGQTALGASGNAANVGIQKAAALARTGVNAVSQFENAKLGIAKSALGTAGQFINASTKTLKGFTNAAPHGPGGAYGGSQAAGPNGEYHNSQSGGINGGSTGTHGVNTTPGAAHQGAYPLSGGSFSPTAGAEQAVDKAGVVINGVLKKATGLVDTGAHIGTGIVNAKVGMAQTALGALGNALNGGIQKAAALASTGVNAVSQIENAKLGIAKSALGTAGQFIAAGANMLKGFTNVAPNGAGGATGGSQAKAGTYGATGSGGHYAAAGYAGTDPAAGSGGHFGASGTAGATGPLGQLSDITSLFKPFLPVVGK